MVDLKRNNDFFFALITRLVLKFEHISVLVFCSDVVFPHVMTDYNN